MKWISIKDYLPGEGRGTLFIRNKVGNYYIATFVKYDAGYEWISRANGYQQFEITHWLDPDEDQLL